MRRLAVLILCLAAVLNLRAGSDEQKHSDPLSVRIVPDSFSEKGGRSIVLYQPEQHFHVIITNTSDKPVRLWREWCSWGYSTLSFQVTDDKGTIRETKKFVRAYTKNYPDWTTIPPGDHMVFEVSSDSPRWPAASLPEKGKSLEVRIKAVFEIPKDKDTEEHLVWTGKVSSPDETYTIYR